MPTKICGKCGEEKSLEFFTRQANGLHGRTSQCKACKAAIARRYYEENKEAILKRQRKRSRGWGQFPYQRYGMSVEDYEKFCSATHCALCEREVDLVTDHCHVTGRVRGRLCTRCNTGLGKFQDDAALLRRAIDYLGGYANGEQAASKPATG